MKKKVPLIFLGLTTLVFSAALAVTPMGLAHSRTIRHSVKANGFQIEPLSLGDTATTLLSNTAREGTDALWGRHLSAPRQND